MFFEAVNLQIPEKRRDRVAVVTMLAIAIPGLVIAAWLVVHSLTATPLAFLASPFGNSSGALTQWQIDAEHLRERLARYKHPKRVHFVDSRIRHANGKVNYRRVRALLGVD